MIANLLALSLLFMPIWAEIPSLPNYEVIFSDDFEGLVGTYLTWSKWALSGCNDGKFNGEQQCYNNLNAGNVHHSGNGQLYIIPKRETNPDGSTYWSSGRIESKGAWACPLGKAMIFQAEIWVPDFTNSPPSTDGLWPAFWALGNVSRSHGIGWPKSGEWDIMEVSPLKKDINQGTIHYEGAGGTPLRQFGRVAYAGGVYHTWAIKIDRRNANSNLHRIIWYLDGIEFKSVWRTDVVDASSWTDLVDKPYFMILNVAIGDTWDWTNDPSENTVSGYPNSMRVKYVGVYMSI